MRTPRQPGQNVSGVIQSFENSSQSATHRGSRPPPPAPAAVRSSTTTTPAAGSGRSASPPPITLSSPPHSSSQLPRAHPSSSSQQSSPPKMSMSSRAASRADQLRSAQTMIETMESRINGSLSSDISSFKVDRRAPPWEPEPARAVMGSLRVRKHHQYSELVLVNGGGAAVDEADVLRSSSNHLTTKQQQASNFISKEEKPTNLDHAGTVQQGRQDAKSNKGSINGGDPYVGVTVKGDLRSAVVSTSPSRGGLPPHRNEAAAEVDERLVSMSEEHAYDMSSPVSSHGEAGEHRYGRHSITSARPRSFSEADLMLVSTEGGIDAFSLMAPQERAKRFVSSLKISEHHELEFESNDSDREPGSPPSESAKTPLDISDTSLEEQSDSTSDAGPTERQTAFRSSLHVSKGTSRNQTSGVEAHRLSHPLKPPEFQERKEESSKRKSSYIASNNFESNRWNHLDEAGTGKKSQGQTEHRTQVEKQTKQRDGEGKKLPTASERLAQRRKESNVLTAEPDTAEIAAAAEKRKKKESTQAGRSLSSRPSSEMLPSTTNREASSTSLTVRAKTGGSTAAAAPQPSLLKRSGSASEVGQNYKEFSQSGQPPQIGRSASLSSDVGQLYKGSKNSSSDEALQPVNPRALPDAGAKLRNVIKSSISVSGVAAAFYRGGYLPVSGMSADDSTAHLNAYLGEVRREAEAGVPGRWLTAVLGSETGGLDSICSSLAYAYLLYSTIKTDQQCFVPIINMRREELPLHMEAGWLLEVTGIDVKSLLFIDEISLSYYHRFGSLRLVLIDHSRLAPHQEGLQEAVVEIVDHVPAGEELNKNEQIYPWVLAREIEQVGSCSTLIAERFASEAPLLLAGRGIGRILLAPILLDTGNLDKSAGQSTSRDETMVTLLLRGAGCYGRNGFYKLLRKKKFDTSVLKTRDLLRKDFNLWTFGPVKSEKHGYRGEKILAGMSSVGMTLGELLSREPGVIEEIVRFREWRRLRLFIIITGYYDRTSIFRRELFIAPEHPELADDLADYFNVSCDDGLKLEPLYVNGLPPEMRAYSQGNATASRKKIQPMLFEFFCT